MISLMLNDLAKVAGPPTLDRVVDGDTVGFRAAECGVDIRLLGIACPVSKHNAKCKRGVGAACDAGVRKGKAATGRAKEPHPGDSLGLESDRTRFKLDRYGRTLAYVRLHGGRDSGLTTLRGGWCADYAWKYPHGRQAEYMAGARR